MPKRITVVVADDNEADAVYLQRRLSGSRELRVETVHLATAQETENYLQSHPVDCVLLDYRLGADSGLELLARLREKGHDTPVIAVSGQGDERVAIEALKLGANDYIPKTAVNTEALERAIVNALDKTSLQRRLQAQQAELQSFVSVVAHDLQQPLAAIANNVELIRDYYGDALDDKGRGFVEAAIRMSRRMSKMIDGLLAYSRVGRGAKPLGAVDLQETIGSVLAALESPIRGKSIEVEVGPLPVVLGEETALAQLFQNLIANAVKFSPASGGRISVSAREVEAGWELQVADNGIGIEPQHHQEIFLPFRRLHPGEYAGSGVGLATCKRIVAQHHGEISVDSSPGQGATFRVELPEYSDVSRGAPAQAPKPSVLVLDDEAPIRAALAELLEMEGFEVRTAADVDEAEQLFAEAKPDLVIADMMMPGRTGFDLLRGLERRGSTVPVVAISGGGGNVSSNPLLERARGLGAVRMVAKPFDHHSMIEAVRDVLSRHETTSA